MQYIINFKRKIDKDKLDKIFEDLCVEVLSISNITGLLKVEMETYAKSKLELLYGDNILIEEIILHDIQNNDGCRDKAKYDLISHIEKQREFSQKTFGPGHRTLGIINHIIKETEEVKKSPLDIYEWIDIIMLGIDGAWRTGASPSEIAYALMAKLEKNKTRSWPKWQECDVESAIEHIK